MLYGTVREMRDFGNYDGFDIACFIVNNPEQPTKHKKSTLVTVYFVALRNGETLGTYSVNNVLSHNTKSHKHALNRVDTAFCIEQAVLDAKLALKCLLGEQR